MTFSFAATTQATSISGSISGTTLTIATRTGTIYVGSVLSAVGVTTTQILQQLTGIAGATGTYRIANSQTVGSFTGGTAVTNTITQTGTDTSYAGLAGLPGVTTIVKDAASGLIAYSLGTSYFMVNGSLTAGVSNPYEQLICGFNASAFGGTMINQAMFQVNGFCKLGDSVIANSVTDGNQTHALIYQPGSGKGQGDSTAQSVFGYNFAGVFLAVNDTGTFEWNYGAIDCWGGIGFHPLATVRIAVSGKKLKPLLNFNRARATNGQAQAQSVYSYAPVTLNGLVMYGGSNSADATALGCIWLQLASPTAFVGYEPRFNRYGFGGSNNMPTGTYIIEDYAGNYGGLGDITKRAGVGNTITLVMKNSALGTSLAINSNNNGGVFNVNVTQDIKVNGFNGGVVCFTDSAGTLYQSSVSVGVATINNIMVGQQLNTGDTTWTRYFGTADTVTLNQWAYEQEYGSVDLELRGLGVATASIPSAGDINSTLSKTAASAKLASSFLVNTTTNTITVTSNSNYDELYDALKAWKCTPTPANLLYPTIKTKPVNASGTSLLTSMYVSVNPGVTLSAGVKFKTLNTTAAVTNAGVLAGNLIANVTTTGAISSSVTITGNVTQATPTNLTGVTISGNLTYNIATSPTVTFGSTSIGGTVSNSGAGTVTISTSSSSIGTVGTRITTRPVTALTINGLTAGSQIYISNGSGAEVAYVASSGTSYTLDTTGQTGTWSWKVVRYGYTSQTGTHSPAVASTETSVTLVADAFVTQTNKATVAAYTILDNNDKLYDYSAYYETTNAGIKYSRVITKAGSSPSAGSYPVTLNDTATLWDFDGSSLSFWAGYTLSAGTTITGALFTTGYVTVPSGINNTAIDANVHQENPADMYGMKITGTLTYNNSDSFPLTVTLTDCTVTGGIGNSGYNYIKVVKAGTSPWFYAGPYVEVVTYVSLTTSNNIALSSHVYRNSIDNGWVAQSTARVLEMNQTDTFYIFAIAYGYQPVMVVANATDPTAFKINLVPESYVDTSLPTSTRDVIASTIQIYMPSGASDTVVYFNSDLSQYSPAEVLNGLHYYLVTSGEVSGIVAQINGFNIVSGGLEMLNFWVYCQVSDSVTSVPNSGFSIPLKITARSFVYVSDPSYTPTRKNSSGIVLQTAPWTQQTAAISGTDKSDIRTGLALENTVLTRASQESVSALQASPTALEIRNAIEAAGSKLDKAMKAAQAAEDNTA